MTIDTFILTGVGSGMVDASRARRWWVGGASALQLAVVLTQLPLTPAEADEVGTRSDRVWRTYSIARSSQVPQRSVNTQHSQELTSTTEECEPTQMACHNTGLVCW